MTPLNQHINEQHAGNVSAFARSVNVSRPTIYGWVGNGAVWHNGRVWTPQTTPPTEDRVAELPVEPQIPNIERHDWGVEGGEVVISSRFHTLNVTVAMLNAADLAAMTEALNNERT